MRLAVPLLIGGGREAEVGADVDEVGDPVDEGPGVALRLAVGQGQEGDVDPVEVARLERMEDQVGVRRHEAGIELDDPVAGVGVGGDVDDLDLRVAGQEPEQLRSRVARPADDCCPVSHGISIRRLA